jgi:hypothetical protein
VCKQSIPDEERLFHRIRPGSTWFEPPDHVTSANFKIRKKEMGISVYRASVVSEDEVLQKPGAIPDSIIVETTAGEIRKLTDLPGVSYNLDVIIVADENDPGHAEIRGEALHLHKNPIAKALQKIFTLSNRK